MGQVTASYAYQMPDACANASASRYRDWGADEDKMGGELSESNCKWHHRVAFANTQWLFLTYFSSWKQGDRGETGLALPNRLQLLNPSDQQI